MSTASFIPVTGGEEGVAVVGVPTRWPPRPLGGLPLALPPSTGRWCHCSHCCPCRPHPAPSWRRRPLRKAFEGSPLVMLPGESCGGVWPLPPPLRRRWLQQLALRLPPEHELPRLPGPAAAEPSALPTLPAPPQSWPSPQRPSVARPRWLPSWRRPPGP